MIIPQLPPHNKYPFELVKLTPEQEKHVNELLFEIDFAKASQNPYSPADIITEITLSRVSKEYKHDALLCEYVMHLLTYIPFPEEE